MSISNKKIFFLIFFLLLFLAAPAVLATPCNPIGSNGDGCTITFDQNLEKRLKEIGVDSDPTTDGSITYGEVKDWAQLVTLNDPKFPLNIASLSGLEYFKSLQILKLDGKTDKVKVKDLAPLAKLKTLEYLELPRNDIEELGPLSGLTNLKELDLHGNKIKDLAPLKGLTQLEKLDVSQNYLLTGDCKSNEKLTSLKTVQDFLKKCLKIPSPPAVESEVNECDEWADGQMVYVVQDGNEKAEALLCQNKQKTVCSLSLNQGFAKVIKGVGFLCGEDDEGDPLWIECERAGNWFMGGGGQAQAGPQGDLPARFFCSSSANPVSGIPFEDWYACGGVQLPGSDAIVSEQGVEKEGYGSLQGKEGYLCDIEKGWLLKPPPYKSLADLNGDGEVNQDDLQWIKDNPAKMWKKLGGNIKNLNKLMNTMNKDWKSI